MKITDTRFGDVEYNPEEVVRFPHGLVGFEHLRDFIVMPNKKQGPLFWIQSVEDPAIAFILTDPTNFFLDYKVVPEQSECELLGAESPDQIYVLSIVTVSPEKNITLNLAAPVLFNPETRQAMQVILEGTSFSPQTPLPTSQQENG